MAKKGKSSKGKGKGGKGKSKGLLGMAASFLGSIPVVGKVKKAAKSLKKKIKDKAKKLKKALKKAKKKLKKKLGKVYTKARKLANNLSKSKMVKKFKQVAKKAVLSTKKAVHNTKAAVTKTGQQVKAAVKDTKKVMTKVGGKIAITYTSFKEGGYKETLSAIADFTPLVGNLKAGVEVAIGRDLFTNRKLEDWERGVGFAAVFGGGLVKGTVRGGKLVSGIVTGGKNTTKNSTSVAKFLDGKTPESKLPKNKEPDKKQTETKGTDKGPIKVKYGDHYTKDGRRKVLKENVEYTTKEGHTYKTDSKGRISSCEGNLELGKGKRNNHAQKVAGREDRLLDDEGGHLIASIFKGSGSLDNLVPMNGNLNKGEWKKLENMWAKQLDKGKSVDVKIKPIYKGDSQRPDSFKIEYKIGDGDWERTDFNNKPGGK